MKSRHRRGRRRVGGVGALPHGARGRLLLVEGADGALWEQLHAARGRCPTDEFLGQLTSRHDYVFKYEFVAFSL
jgi:hypothetical protein